MKKLLAYLVYSWKLYQWEQEHERIAKFFYRQMDKVSGFDCFTQEVIEEEMEERLKWHLTKRPTWKT
jgi:hypothetical protein